MQTELLKIDENSIDKAAEILRAGGIVAIPTETVYGLAGNAFDPAAVKSIFVAKGRPGDNPLILHIADLEMLGVIADGIPPLAEKLAKRFWPGSLTMIFKKKDIVPPETNGGMSTVAVRMPNHALTLELIRRCGFPLAAPSANTSGLPSPTSAQHVFDDMNGIIPLILDGGRCSCGVESTVVCFTEKGVKILRPGAVTPEMLSEFCPVEIDRTVLESLKIDEKPISPGTKYKHYSPKAEVFVVETDSEEKFAEFAAENAGEKVYFLAKSAAGITANTLPYGESAAEEAGSLFSSLRKADDLGAEKVYVRAPSKDGIGLAVYNRLLRAAAFKIIRI